jgi:hypothetical protein
MRKTARNPGKEKYPLNTWLYTKDGDVGILVEYKSGGRVVIQKPGYMVFSTVKLSSLSDTLPKHKYKLWYTKENPDYGDDSHPDGDLEYIDECIYAYTLEGIAREAEDRVRDGSYWHETNRGDIFLVVDRFGNLYGERISFERVDRKPLTPMELSVIMDYTNTYDEE